MGARTFLFLYLYTLPFALLDSVEDNVEVFVATIFFVTYGFVGLETVSIELDNPFGEDENDFDNMGMAQTALLDTEVTLFNVDGEESRQEFAEKVKHVVRSGG